LSDSIVIVEAIASGEFQFKVHHVVLGHNDRFRSDFTELFNSPAVPYVRLIRNIFFCASCYAKLLIMKRPVNKFVRLKK